MNARAGTFTPNARLALHLAAHGLPVFPCNPATKQPCVPKDRGGRGFHDATADAGQVRRWWAEWPDALPGLPTGAASGLYVVDLDVDRDTGEPVGEATWRTMGLADLLAGAVATPSGGRHIYFRDPGPGFGNTAKGNSRSLGPGIDTRGGGGYVIAPGAEAPGGRYAPPEGWTWDAFPDLPLSVKARLAAPRDRGRPAGPDATDPRRASAWAEAALAAELGRVMAAAPGGRNHALNAAAFALGQIVGGGGLDEASTRARLLAAAQAAGLPGGEAQATVASGLGAGMQEPRTAPERAQDARERPGRGEGPRDRQHGPAAPPEPPQRTFEWFRLSDLDGVPVPEREWTVPDWIPSRTVTLLGGDGGTGKSLLALQLAVAASTGGRWLGQEVTPGDVVFLSAEDERDELHRRAHDILADEGRPYREGARLSLLSVAGEDALLAVEAALGLTSTVLFGELEARAAAGASPSLVVIDTLADCYPANENDRAKVRQFVGLLRGLAIRQRCAVLLLAHPSLTGMASGTGTSGSTGWNNSVRSRLYFSRVESREGDKVHEPDPDVRVLANKKLNYGRAGGEMMVRWRRGVFALDAGAPVTGLDRMAAGAKAERVFLSLLDQFTADGRNVSANPSVTFAPALFAKHSDREGLTRVALKDAMDALFKSGAIVVETFGRGSKERTRLARAGRGDRA